jgi:hypothetical protein
MDDLPEVKVCCRPLATDPIGALLSTPRVTLRHEAITAWGDHGYIWPDPGYFKDGSVRADPGFSAGGQHLKSVP